MKLTSEKAVRIMTKSGRPYVNDIRALEGEDVQKFVTTKNKLHILLRGVIVERKTSHMNDQKF